MAELCPSCGAYWECEHRSGEDVTLALDLLERDTHSFGFQTILDDGPDAPEMEPAITMQDEAGNHFVLIDECHRNP